jgi:N-acetylneuraminic acid mutarotase
MKNYLLISIAASVFLLSCKENNIQDFEPSEQSSSWLQLQDFTEAGADERFEPDGFGFSIGDKGYLSSGGFEMPTFKEYDTKTKLFVVKQGIGDFRSDLVAFSIGLLGYAGSGIGLAGGGDTYGLDHFQEYNPQTDTWRGRARLPETLSEAVGFSINGLGYIGVGKTDTVRPDGSGVTEQTFYPSKSLYEYNPDSDCWIKKADFPGEPRTGAVAFTIGSKAYVGTGLTFDGSRYLQDFWEYDQTTNTWTKKADFPGLPRSNAVGFAIREKGYIGTGGSRPSGLHKDFWEYDAALNVWKQIEDFPGGGRSHMIYFSTQTKGYVAGGSGTVYNLDFWEFDPTK